MVRSGFNRISKFSAKLDGDVAKERLRHYKDTQVKLYAGTVGKQVEIENQIKEYMSANNLPVLDTNYYILFAKKLFKLVKKYNADILIEEVKIEQAKWEARGLDGLALQGIKDFYIPTYVNYHFFRLDVSDLDGNDRLA